MTEENYHYRTSPFLLRNQFAGSDKWEIPVIPKAEFSDGEFTGLRLIGFDRTKLENTNHLDRMVHFFLYDYKFERVWKNRMPTLKNSDVIAPSCRRILACIRRWPR